MRMLFTFIVLILILENTLLAQEWQMPCHLSEANTKVQFEIDSTWHKIVGKVKDFSGDIWLSNSLDPKSIRARLTFPVLGFDTDNKSRDHELRHVMHVDAFPNVEYELTRVDGICSLKEFEQAKYCNITLSGNLKISGVMKEVSIPGSILFENNIYKVSGTLPISWGEYGVEDPSIFIAKLDPIAQVKFSLDIPSKALKEDHAKHT